jgi:hypothetical protein
MKSTNGSRTQNSNIGGESERVSRTCGRVGEEASEGGSRARGVGGERAGWTRGGMSDEGLIQRPWTIGSGWARGRRG